MTSRRLLMERRFWRQLEAAREAVTAGSTSYREIRSAHQRLAAAVSRYESVLSSPQPSPPTGGKVA